ncbi:MAG: glycosyltransferase [Deltaproteobacteria bacterium]|nr:glycosyltransferase [Deltaproteobacteria bacterium]TLN01064.1 MAG: glycosyltransferase family 4 protein [bacterium]
MKQRLAIMLNIVAPYRIPILVQLSRKFDATILISGGESNRREWDEYVSRLKEKYGLLVKQVAGYTFTLPKKKNNFSWDNKYLHINPGYFIELFRCSPEAIISNEMGFRTIAALAYGMLFRVPVWVWWGGTLYTEQNVSLLKRALRQVIARHAKHWISYGATSTEYLLSLGIPRRRILQIQNCVDESKYVSFPPPAFVIEPRPVLLYVGQLIGRKGVRQLLEAASRMQKREYLFSLLLVGKGSEQESLEEYVRKIGLQHVHFIPSLPPDEMPAVYRSADCLVFPTQEDVWGLVVNEALWSGLPVLSSVYAGCTREIVPKANHFDPFNPNDFDRVLERALEHKLAPADTSPLIPSHQVAEFIINDINKALSN